MVMRGEEWWVQDMVFFFFGGGRGRLVGCCSRWKFYCGEEGYDGLFVIVGSSLRVPY